MPHLVFKYLVEKLFDHNYTLIGKRIVYCLLMKWVTEMECDACEESIVRVEV